MFIDSEIKEMAKISKHAWVELGLNQAETVSLELTNQLQNTSMSKPIVKLQLQLQLKL